MNVQRISKRSNCFSNIFFIAMRRSSISPQRLICAFSGRLPTLLKIEQVQYSDIYKSIGHSDTSLKHTMSCEMSKHKLSL